MVCPLELTFRFDFLYSVIVTIITVVVSGCTQLNAVPILSCLKARLKSLYKHAGQLVYENIKKETDLKIWDKGERKKRPPLLQTNQVEQFYCQRLGQEILYPISNAIKAVL